MSRTRKRPPAAEPAPREPGPPAETEEVGQSAVEVSRAEEPPNDRRGADAPSEASNGEPSPRYGSDIPAHPGLEKAAPRSISSEHLKSVIESLVFVADRPLPVHRIARIARARTAEVQHMLGVLAEEYRGRGIELAEVAGGWQFRSAAENAPFVRELVARKPVRLTRPQVETLAIIAYRQPVTRPEIDEIRGVDSGSALKVLLERNLVKIIGRKDEPGRPLLYGTTPGFLELFGLRALSDLPTLKEYSELTEESRALFARKTGESLEDIGDIEIDHRTYSDEELEGIGAQADRETTRLEAGAEEDGV